MEVKMNLGFSIKKDQYFDVLTPSEKKQIHSRFEKLQDRCPAQSKVLMNISSLEGQFKVQVYVNFMGMRWRSSGKAETPLEAFKSAENKMDNILNLVSKNL